MIILKTVVLCPPQVVATTLATSPCFTCGA